MTIHPKAALTYSMSGPQGFDALFPLLHEHDLYAVDRRWEACEHIALPSADRPVLRFLLQLAEHANDPMDPLLTARQLVRAERDRIEYFVCADVSDLGRDGVEQVAVVGTLLGYGLSVVAGAEVLDADWYRSQLKARGGRPALGIYLKALEQPPSDSPIEGLVAAFSAWAAATPWVPTTSNPFEQFFIPTSWLLNYDTTVARALQLQARGLVIDRIADCLTVEGYVDRQGARTWYWTKVDSLLREAAVDRGAGKTGLDRVG